ncbi:MAG: hypothetical protein QOH36_379 [Actinomycetota bacterium]|nr:hypothetical protein [Actinomycetota bacterium]
MTEDENHDPSAEDGPDDGAPSRIHGVASSIAGAGGTVISAALTPVRSLASGANRIIGERPGARVRRIREMGHNDLVNLWDVHAEARRASIRELGLISVPVDRIRGTAVEGPVQRGGDFLPLRARRSHDWRSRWQRILNALDRLESLPPVDLIKFGDDYWVVDGHNRVAAALYNGQVELDAVVEELRLPGMKSRPSAPPNIASVLDGSLDLRAAGSGRLSRTANRPDDLEGVQQARDLEAEIAAEDAAE